jgi:hypothetical protein
VFFAGKTFFFGCRNQLAVHEQGGGGIVVVTGNTKYIHCLSLFQ